MDLDYYKILGIEKNASKEDIKKAYKKLAIKYHPDKNSGELLSEEIFKKVKKAYETLINDEKRKIYDVKTVVKPNKKTPKTNSHIKNTIYDDGISNKKASLLALGFFLLVAIIVLPLYPYANRWASNHKLKSAYKSIETENWAEALVFSSAAIEQYEENGRAYLLRAQLNSSIFKKYHEAISDFNTAQNLLPADSIFGEHYYMMAKAHHELGNTKIACEKLSISIEKGFKRAQEDYNIICKQE